MLGFTPTDCAKTVLELLLFRPFGLASSEKQIPQVVLTIKNHRKPKEILEATTLRPRQWFVSKLLKVVELGGKFSYKFIYSGFKLQRI